MEPGDTTLLVVDDNEMNRDMLSRRLQRRGFGVLVAADGEKALEIVDKETVDLVLLDIMMPGIDGIEVLKRLRAKHSQVQLPVIMATAKAHSEDVVKALELGANDYVTKPIDFPVVLARVQAQLRTKAAAPAPRSGEPTAAEIEPGVVLAKKYRLEELIGSGNFGAVYRARHLDLDLDVAVKVLLPNFTANEESMRRFRQEGVAACRVRHPNAVTVSDFGVTETGVAFLVMELLQGTTLVDEIRRYGKVPPQRCLEILQPVCEVLAEAHAAGLVHRDVKPENIFLHVTPRGEEIKVLDFGIAKLVGETVTQENLTAEGWILGTPAYIAPERVNDQGYDGRSDVYSVGILLFEMLTGKRPFRTSRQDPMGLLMMHVNAEPPTLRSVAPELSAELEELVARTIRKRPDERPDARGLAEGLARAIPPVAAEPPPIAVAGSVGGSIDPNASTMQLPLDEQEGGLKGWLRRIAGTRD
jgi:DNA-binding response OmpR family regulator